MLNRTFSPLNPAARLLFGFVLASPLFAAHSGTPSDGHWAPAANGLGQAVPQAPDLASDPAWKVYEFERDGIVYVQVSDQYNRVRAATGRIGETMWVMPIGTDADRVVVQGDKTPSGTPRLLYQSDEVEVVLYQDGSQQRLLIRAPDAAQ